MVSSSSSNRHLNARANAALTLGWAVMIPIAFATGWIDSVRFVSVLSLWALVASHWAAWLAARSKDEAQRRDDTAPPAA
jgi:hypothetical protein